MIKALKQNEILYFALRNNKLKIGASVLLVFILFCGVGGTLIYHRLQAQ